MCCSRKSKIIKSARTFGCLVSKITAVLASSANNDLPAWKSIMDSLLRRRAAENCFNLVVNKGWVMGKRPLCLSFCAHSIGQRARDQNLGLRFAVKLSIFCHLPCKCFAPSICLITRQVLLSWNTAAAGRVLVATSIVLKKRKEKLVAQSVGSGLSAWFLLQATVEDQRYQDTFRTLVRCPWAQATKPPVLRAPVWGSLLTRCCCLFKGMRGFVIKENISACVKNGIFPSVISCCSSTMI